MHQKKTSEKYLTPGGRVVFLITMREPKHYKPVSVDKLPERDLKIIGAEVKRRGYGKGMATIVRFAVRELAQRMRDAKASGNGRT